MKTSVIAAQNESIKELSITIRSFLKGHRKTRVIPLSIPTGWGKTRIAIQGILRADYSTAPTVIIWPQTQAHISDEVWKDRISWCAKSKNLCENCVPPPIDKLVVNRPGIKEGRDKNKFYKSHRIKQFRGVFYYVNNNFSEGVKKSLKRIYGPIIFIIDEWHTKKFLEKYDGADAEKFWRRKLLGTDNKRKLFIILVSATPIGATSDMDNILTKKEDDAVDDEECFKEQIKDALKKFQKLTEVGNQKREYKLHQIYKDLIKKEASALRVKQKNAGHIPGFHKRAWLEEYVKVLQKVYANKWQFPSNPIHIYPLETLSLSGATKEFIRKFPSLKSYFKYGFNRQLETLKLKTVYALLQKYRKQKFVIFCHHKTAELSLEHYLKQKGISCCGHGEMDKFNEESRGPRVLIVMDRYSQGISMHQSKAWLIHFELSWNPIRIIQRYGRVWRIDKEKKNLTKPLAFYIPHTFSSEEEMIRRIERRWGILKDLSGEEEANFVYLAPISFEVALGIRCSPHFAGE